MHQFLATCFVENSKLNLKIISVPSCFLVTQGILPNTTQSLGKKEEHKTRQLDNQKSIFHQEGMTRLEMTPVPETEGRHTWDCEQHFNMEGMSSSTAVTGMARNSKECLAGISKQARLYHHLLPSPEHPRLVCASTPTLLKEQAHLQPKTLSL